MLSDNHSSLINQIQSINYGILKIESGLMFKNNRCLVETLRIDHVGNIWCKTSEKIDKLYNSGKSFKISLKYVNKIENQYLIISGKAFVEERSEFIKDNLSGDTVQFATNNAITLRVEVKEGNVFKRTALSKYTSILQSVFKFNWATLASRPTYPARRVA